jgi:hypothetical protein
MGFYGNIQNSNKTAFTFDMVYSSRNLMDEMAQKDGVFLGRYVLVDYDETFVEAYYHDDWFYNDPDFTDYSNNEDARYKGYDYSSRVLERMIEDFPYDKNIVHALLGGNHDYNLLSYGVDFVDSLAKARTDFVNLGYEHASVNFSPKSKIMLHHMDIKVADSFGKDEYKVDDLIHKIKSYYKINNLNRSDYYIDLLGHFHKSSLDLVNGIGLVPSLFKDRVFDGAWHLRLYFNADKSIKHIVVIPLIRNDKKLVPNGEINYQRLNLKK